MLQFYITSMCTNSRYLKELITVSEHTHNKTRPVESGREPAGKLAVLVLVRGDLECSLLRRPPSATEAGL